MLNRKIKLTVGPKVINGSGGYDGFRMSFKVQKTILGSPNMTEILVYNLDRNTRSIIRERHLDVILEVGHEDTELLELFIGTTTSVIIYQDGPDVITAITAMDGAIGVIYATQQITYDGPIPVADVVEELALTLENGIEVGPIIVDGKLKEKGRSLSGTTQQILDMLANEYGYSWSVQNMVFQAISDLEALPQVFVISPETGLQSAQALLSGAFMVQIGTEIQALLNPRINPGQQVNLISKLDPGLNGEYKVHNLDFTGETHGDAWNMNLQCFIVGDVW